MNKRVAILITFSLLIASGNAGAQSKDAQLWLGVNLEKKLNPKLSLYFTEELRMNENITEAGTIFSDLGIGYNIIPGLSASANYRFINKRKLDNSYDTRHRYYFDLAYKYALKPVTFSLRARYQSQYTDVFSSETGKIPENYERTKAKLAFDFGKPLRPYASVEAFLPLNRNSGELFIDCMRYSAGLEYKLNARNSLDIFYLIQKEMNVADPETDFVVGLGYSFVF